MKVFVLPENYVFLLPRNYLSYSAMTCWIKSPTRFRKEYFENGRKLDTKYLRFGKGIAKMIEEGTYKELLPDLIVLGTPEYEIRTMVRGLVPVLSYIDDYANMVHAFQEFKTGKAPWTKTRVQKHEQLPFYATALKWKTSIMPKWCNLVWLETSDEAESIVGPRKDSGFWNEVENRSVHLTGKTPQIFRREFDEREIERMEDLIIKTAYEISEAYKSFIAEI